MGVKVNLWWSLHVGEIEMPKQKLDFFLFPASLNSSQSFFEFYEILIYSTTTNVYTYSLLGEQPFLHWATLWDPAAHGQPNNVHNFLFHLLVGILVFVKHCAFGIS